MMKKVIIPFFSVIYVVKKIINYLIYFVKMANLIHNMLYCGQISTKYYQIFKVDCLY